MSKLVAVHPFTITLGTAEAAKAGLTTPQDGDIFPFVAGQDIPDALADHWYVKALMETGAVTEAPSAKENKAKSTG